MKRTARQDLTVERLRELLSYDPITGIFRWRVQRRCATVGSVAGNVRKETPSDGGGYRLISIDGRNFYAHRLAWLYMTGTFPDHRLDHRDTERDNNRWGNLRAASVSQNGGNSKLRPHNTSGFKGVSFSKQAKKWIANIQKDSIQYYLGLFDTPEAAHEAYMKAANHLFGEFARAA